MSDRIPMTPEGFEKLRNELSQIKSVDRPQTVTAIEVAREHGDLRENAEYHAAKEKMSFINGRIQELESYISLAEVIDPKLVKEKDRIVFGAKVTLLDPDNDKESTYQIVGEFESDVTSGKISVKSPMAKAMISKKMGDAVVVKTPKGPKEYEVAGIKYE
ncbi:transcription elongation factor GreA [bacterium]|nr:transcription elongation factor GreA [bacterium]